MEEAAKAKELLKGYLNKRMRVANSDGRVIDGNFLCTDRDSNIVLGNCEEFASQKDLGSWPSQVISCRRHSTVFLASRRER